MANFGQLLQHGQQSARVNHFVLVLLVEEGGLVHFLKVQHIQARIALPDSREFFLVLGGVSAETASHLLEIDPRTGITNRSLALPEPAHRLALAPDGAAVWVGCPTGTVQRVDLKDGTLGSTL